MSETPTPVLTPRPFTGPEVVPLNPGIPHHSIGSQIRLDAEARDRADLVGLCWEQDGKRFVINNHEVVHKARGEYRKRGLPRYHRDGRVHKFDRQSHMTVAYDEVQSYELDIYDSDGNLLEASNFDQRQLNDMWRSSDIKEVTWLPKEDEPVKIRQTNLALNGDEPDPFESIVTQLEAENITSLEGLRWDKGNHTIEIKKEAEITEHTKIGKKPSRIWLLDVTRPNKDGKPEVVEQRTYTEYELRKYLLDSKLNQKNKVRLAQKVSSSELAKEELDAKERAQYKYLYGLMDDVPVPEYISPDIVGEKMFREDLINDYAKSDTKILPRSVPQSDRTPIWLLSYTDILPMERAQDLMKQLANPKRKTWETMIKAESEKRIEALKQAIPIHGLEKIVETALQYTEDYRRSIEKLGLPINPEGLSVSWALENLADQFYYANNPDEIPAELQDKEYSDPFLADNMSKKTQRDVVDAKIGIDFARSAYKASTPTPVLTGEVNEFGQPVYHIPRNTIVDPNALLLIDGPNSKQKKEIKELLKKNDVEIEPTKIEINNILEQILESSNNNMPISNQYFLRIGRLLRRTVGE